MPCCRLSLLCLFVFASGSRLLAQGFPPEEAVKRMQVPPAFRVRLIASEPDVRQPVSMSFDDRGRLWVLQYLQYPTPAGLKPVQVDQYLRTVYDRVPEPPPRGPRGADKITIFEDAGGDGRYRKVRDFVTGLNLASGMALGHGGVFVAQPPYLLFYPDRNGDDVPDGDPEVLLTGFGMQDAHAFANSLQWGPDGWLYGAQGSTVTADIRGVQFQQGIWRYHPITRAFELFAEGGGNTWGLDFDRHGHAIAGTNYNAICLHQVQGAYYVKGFSKHGELHNPYAFGYFEHVPYKGFKGGHVTCGGIIYEGGVFPERFEHTYIAANPLANAVYWHVLEPQGSSFKGRFGGDFLIANDTWFRPVDLALSPDGSVFIADWYDKRINHVDPVDNWDRSNGRIYKVERKTTRPASGLPLGKHSSKELLGYLRHPNHWYRREARRILAERRDSTVVAPLRQMIKDNEDDLALEALWALYVSGGFSDAVAEKCLKHANPNVRAWTVRLLGDQKEIPQEMAKQLWELANQETSPTVRNQFACTCKRLPGYYAIDFVDRLLQHTDDEKDSQIPLLLWWAIEDKVTKDSELVLGLLNRHSAWWNPILRNTIIERLSRRYMTGGTDENLKCCAKLLGLAPGPSEVDLVLRGMEAALEGRFLHEVPAPLEKALAEAEQKQPAGGTLLRLRLRLGDEHAYRQAQRSITDGAVTSGERVRLIGILSQITRTDCVPPLLHLFENKHETLPVRVAALSALQSFANTEIFKHVMASYSSLTGDLRGRAQALLCNRPESARLLLAAVDAGRVAPKEFTWDQLRQIQLHHDPELDRLIEKHWGRVGPALPGEKRARIASIRHMLGTGTGHPTDGKPLFQQKCAICHTLFGEGNKVGPDLTTADRKNTDFLVTSIVDPSAVVRNEYVAYVVATANGRVLTGLMAEATPQTITLLDSKNERTTLARADIDEIKPSPLSLMPEKILDDLDEQQIRDLLSYIQGDGPPKPSQTTQAQSLPNGKQQSPSAKSRPLKVCLVSGSLEYQSDESLASLQEYLESHFSAQCSRAFRRSDNDLPGLESLESCDVMLLFTRRLTISGEQLERVKKYCRSGKPIVAVRTASHAFQNWLALDKEVLGGNYRNHYGAGPPVQVRIVDKAIQHPILTGLAAFDSPGSLYKNPDLPADDEILLTGSIPGHTEPVAWTRRHNGGRVFYTSLGHPSDFKDPNFVRLLVNALFWVTDRPVAGRSPK